MQMRLGKLFLPLRHEWHRFVSILKFSVVVERFVTPDVVHKDVMSPHGGHCDCEYIGSGLDRWHSPICRSGPESGLPSWAFGWLPIKAFLSGRASHRFRFPANSPTMGHCWQSSVKHGVNSAPNAFSSRACQLFSSRTGPSRET
jgi:hypothetical protein